MIVIVIIVVAVAVVVVPTTLITTTVSPGYDRCTKGRSLMLLFHLPRGRLMVNLIIVPVPLRSRRFF